MHSATCPSCGTRVELDFKPVAGQVWCPTCQKVFSPSAVSGAEPENIKQIDTSENGDGKAG
jgi:uncharacterized Zn finger protein (UPF0148 family)